MCMSGLLLEGAERGGGGGGGGRGGGGRGRGGGGGDGSAGGEETIDANPSFYIQIYCLYDQSNSFSSSTDDIPQIAAVI